jgi:hypothetical protein
VPKMLERENNLSVTSAVYRLAKIVRLLDKLAGTPKIAANRVSGIRLVARLAVKRIGVTLESVCRSYHPAVSSRTAGEGNEHQP